MDASIDQGEKAGFRVSSESNSLTTYENNGDRVINFDLYLSQVKLSPQPEPPDSENMIPVEEISVVKENLEIQPHTALSMTPADWENLGETSIQYETTPIRRCSIVQIFGEHSKETELLRLFRDEVLSKTSEGQDLISLYYMWSPAIVKIMEKDEAFEGKLNQLIGGLLPMIEAVVQ